MAKNPIQTRNPRKAPEWPLVTVDVTDNGDGSLDVQVEQQVAGDTGFGAALFVRLTDDNTETDHDVFIDFGVAGAKTVTVTTTPPGGFVYTSHLVDAHANTLIREVPTTASTAPAMIPEPNPRNPWAAW